MNEVGPLFLALAAGGILGVTFFVGLLYTVRKGLTSDQPALWFFASHITRMAIALAGFYIISGGHWERLLMCLAGFTIARIAVSKLTRPPQEVKNAPQS